MYNITAQSILINVMYEFIQQLGLYPYVKLLLVLSKGVVIIS